MPIQIKAPDGSIAQFPDGMADADIEKVMAQHYPAPSMLDRAVASPVGRFAHDVIIDPLQRILAGPANFGAALGNAIPGQSHNLAGEVVTGGNLPAPSFISDPAIFGAEQPYQASLAANRNTPGYAKARASADALQAKRGSGFQDQMLAPYLPSLAGVAGVPGGFDAMNANADSQAAGQAQYAAQNPLKSMAAGLLGGGLAAPEGAVASIPIRATDSPALTRLSHGNVTGPFPMPQASAPTVASLKSDAKALYQKIDNSGISVSNDTMNKLGDSVQDRFGQRLDPTLHPDATAAYNRLTQYATDGAKGGEAASFTDLDNLRRIVADASSATKPADKAMARMMLDHVDDFVDGLKATDLDTSLQDQLRGDLVQATGAKVRSRAKLNP
jgi:hypothetical protein